MLEESQMNEPFAGPREKTAPGTGINRAAVAVRDVVSLYRRNSLLERREIERLSVAPDGLHASRPECGTLLLPFPLLENQEPHQWKQREPKQLNWNTIHTGNMDNVCRSARIASRRYRSA